jgi:membrane protein implicated in regulation of membrane protease activity
MSSQYVAALVWLVVGFLLLLGEALLPGMVLALVGAAAILVSLLAVAGLDSIALQFLCFALLTAGTILLLRRRLLVMFKGAQRGGVDEDGTGQPVQAVADFVEGHGRVRWRGAEWDARAADDIPVAAGDWLLIVGHDGLRLKVAPEHPRAGN